MLRPEGEAGNPPAHGAVGFSIENLWRARSTQRHPVGAQSLSSNSAGAQAFGLGPVKSAQRQVLAVCVLQADTSATLPDFQTGCFSGHFELPAPPTVKAPQPCLLLPIVLPCASHRPCLSFHAQLAALVRNLSFSLVVLCSRALVFRCSRCLGAVDAGK